MTACVRLFAGAAATGDVGRDRDTMVRIHGGTQKGKTSAALAIVAAALAQAYQVVVIDNRGFKNWHVAGRGPSMVDARQPQDLVAALAKVHGEYERREPILAPPGQRHRAAEGSAGRHGCWSSSRSTARSG